MEPFALLLASALAPAIVEVSKALGDLIVKPALESAGELIKVWLQKPYRQKERDLKLKKAIENALKASGVSVEDEDKLLEWAKRTGLERLTSIPSAALRRQLAQAVLFYTDPNAAPPEALIQALRWPRTRADELRLFLGSLRLQMSGLEEYRQLLEAVNDVDQRGLLRQVIEELHALSLIHI